MKEAVRAVVRLINRAAVKFACETNGDVASLVPNGPCERCVGRAIQPDVSVASVWADSGAPMPRASWTISYQGDDDQMGVPA